ncbi:MAG: hypothetical protein MUP45_02390 [Candidatus Marinimicrobia bacterium]|nr:hypothetical protein [Candidatus Neomarinimicrobiota bacterium]
MDPKHALITLLIRTGWGAAGVLMGVYALLSVWRRWRKQGQTLSLNTKLMWWFQVILTPVSILFVLWIVLILRGNPIQVHWVVMVAMFVCSLLALPNAFLLVVSENWRIFSKED